MQPADIEGAIYLLLLSIIIRASPSSDTCICIVIDGYSEHNAPFQITILVRFSSVWFSLVTVLLIVCPRSLLLCPFHKKLRIWWKKSFGFCQTDNPRSSFMMYCYSTDLNVYTWVELTYQNRQVFWIQFLT